MPDMFLSIIIPVYNIENYLGHCLDSLIPQVLGKDNIEVLLIDDGSVDASGNICDAYAKKYENFIVIHKKNSGLSSARNTGICSASGKFLMFLDGDDFLCKNAIDQIVNELTDFPNTDVLIGRYISYDLSSKEYKECGYHLDKEGIEKNRGSDLLYILLNGNTYDWYAWLNIVRKNYITSNHFFFKEGVVFEDAIWTPDVLFSAQNVRYIDKPFYVYLQNRNDSITKKFSEKSYIDKWEALKYVENFCAIHSVNNDLEKKLWGNLNLIFTSLLFDSWQFSSGKRKQFQNKLNKYKMIYRYSNRKYQNILYGLWKIIGVKGVSFILYLRAQWVRHRR